MRTFTPWHLFVGWILPQTSGLNLATMPTCELTIRFLHLIRDVIKYVWFWFKRWLLWIWNFVMYFLWTHSRCADVYIFTVWPFALYFISTFMRIIFSVWSNSDHIFQNKQTKKSLWRNCSFLIAQYWIFLALYSPTNLQFNYCFFLFQLKHDKFVYFSFSAQYPFLFYFYFCIYSLINHFVCFS